MANVKKLRTAVEWEGQPYVDEPVVHQVRPHRLAAAINRGLSALTGGGGPDLSLKEWVSHYERRQLNWVKPRNPVNT